MLLACVQYDRVLATNIGSTPEVVGILVKVLYDESKNFGRPFFHVTVP